jgi:hypothetical protein
MSAFPFEALRFGLQALLAGVAGKLVELSINNWLSKNQAIVDHLFNLFGSTAWVTNYGPLTISCVTMLLVLMLLLRQK